MRNTTRFRSLIWPLSLAVTIATCLALGAGMILDRGSWSEGDGDWGEAYDAGRLLADARPVVSRTFRVVNRGSRTIKLINRSCTCTCTTSELSRDTLNPGQSATFDMAIKMPGGYSGKSTVRCELMFDDNRARIYTITYESFPRMLIENVTD